MSESAGQAAPRPVSEGDLPPEASAQLAAAYRALDRRLVRLGVECRACGRCCDFRRNHYRLYACFLERAPIVARHGAPRLSASGHCGFLVEGRCSIHAWRPLGCRVFFCAPEHKAREQELYQAFQRRLRAATDRHGLPWDYQPLFDAARTE
ncbi:MAG TPA: hypothetical protein VNE39_28375 [Planctomycetota bacterium]|nr:hypothetical protein [Planctomycetota bacterium]